MKRNKVMKYMQEYEVEVPLDPTLIKKANSICQQFNGSATVSDVKFAKRFKPQFNLYQDDIAVTQMKTYVEEGIAFNIPASQIENFLNMFNDDKINNVIIRSENPMLQKAWEKYLTLLALFGGSKHGY